MKNKKVEYKGTGAYKLTLIGLGLIILPYALIVIDAVLGISEGANIGLGLLALVTWPIGFVLVFIGLFRLLYKAVKK